MIRLLIYHCRADAENLLQNDSENSYIIDRASAMIATRMSDEESDIDMYRGMLNNHFQTAVDNQQKHENLQMVNRCSVYISDEER